MPDEAALRAAGYLEQAAVPQCAAVLLLADEKDYLLAGDEAEAALQWLEQYERLNRFNRANALSQTLGGEWSDARYNTFWLQQAQLMLHRGETANVAHALQRLRAPLDAAMSRERQSLLGQALLQQRRFAEAAEAFKLLAGDSGSLYDHYNLALALIGQGGATGAQGRKLLDELSRRSGADAEGLALRDRINQTLGWSWLTVQKGGTARPYFRQVRLHGPDAGMALLGMGWAELAPNGERQFAPVMMGFYYEFLFEPAAVGAERFRRALRPWRALSQRPLHDPPVQEALLAIAYSHEKLADRDATASAYRHAIGEYQAEAARLDRLAAELNRPEADPRQVAERQAQSGEFGGVEASHAFIQLASELDRLRNCGYELDGIRDGAERFQRQLLARLARVAESMSDARAQRLAELRRQYLDDLDERRRRLRTYLARASFALALLQDRQGASR